MADIKTKWAEACIENHKGEPVIAIRVPVRVLPDALHQNPRDDSCYAVKVVDVPGFAGDVVRELNAEAEDGTTPIHELFDKAMATAIDNGSLACDFTEAAKADKGQT